MDPSQLSESQQLALQQYTAVTDQDIQAAISLLERSQWNVEIAIAKFFDGEGPDLVAEALAAQNAPPIRAARQENLQQSLLQGSYNPRRELQSDPAPRIVPQPDSDVIRQPPFLLALLFTPFSILYKIFSKSMGLFSFLFPFLPRALRPSASGTATRRANTGGRRSLKPRDSAARLKREFEEEYGPNTLPFYEGSYASALDTAKNNLQFLIIILFSPEHDDTSAFIHETLLSDSVQAFFNDSSLNLIFWAGDLRDSEAYQVSTALNCTKFPFTAVVAHTPAISSTAMSVISRVAGPMDPETYISKVRAAISGHEETLSVVRTARQAQNFERNLREEQESAYERSLARDREKARLKREAEEQEREQARREKEEAVAATTLAQKKLQWRRWRASRIADEPNSEVKDTVRIAIKLPEQMGAARVMRKFKANSEVEEIYAFVECYDLLQSGVDTEKVSEPQSYSHRYDFRLVQTLPRVVYPAEDGGTIGEKIGRSGNLIVEKITDDEEA